MARAGAPAGVALYLASTTAVKDFKFSSFMSLQHLLLLLGSSRELELVFVMLALDGQPQLQRIQDRARPSDSH